MNDRALAKISSKIYEEFTNSKERSSEEVLDYLKKTTRYFQASEEEIQRLITRHRFLARDSGISSIAVKTARYDYIQQACKRTTSVIDQLSDTISLVRDQVVYYTEAMQRYKNQLDRNQYQLPFTNRDAFEELMQIEREFGGYGYNSKHKQLSVRTDYITLPDEEENHVDLGRFEIVLDLNKLNENPSRRPYYINALDPHPASMDEELVHPHVRNNSLCEGEGAVAITRALNDGRICDFFTIVTQGLSTYNPDSPYLPLKEWFYSARCARCDRLLSDDDIYRCGECEDPICDECSYFCERCDTSICDNHHYMCDRCEVTICSECSNQCSICNNMMCPGCTENCADCRQDICNDHIANCEECGDLLCQNCVIVCPDCGMAVCSACEEDHDCERENEEMFITSYTETGNIVDWTKDQREIHKNME